jgi:hypothetical protein
MSASRAVTLSSRLGTVVVAATLALTGCSGDGDDAADGPTPTPTVPAVGSTPSASPAVTPVASAGSPPDAPAARDTVASRKAFARVVVDSWSHALMTNRAEAVTRLSTGRRKGRPCQGCEELGRELAEREREGWSVDFPGADVGRTTVRPAARRATWIARAEVDIPASRSYFDDGTFRNDNEAHEGATFEVSMRKDGRRWTLLGFRVIT